MDTGVRSVASLVTSVVTSLVAALVALVLPALTTLDPTTAAVLTVGVVAMTLLRPRTSTVRLVVGRVRAAGPPTRAVPPLLPARVTDPVRHPLRPRAPGLA